MPEFFCGIHLITPDKVVFVIFQMTGPKKKTRKANRPKRIQNGAIRERAKRSSAQKLCKNPDIISPTWYNQKIFTQMFVYLVTTTQFGITTHVCATWPQQGSLVKQPMYVLFYYFSGRQRKAKLTASRRKASVTPRKKQVPSLDCLNLLHTQTVLSTSPGKSYTWSCTIL